MEGQAEMVKQIGTIFRSHRVWCIKIFVWLVQYVITCRWVCLFQIISGMVMWVRRGEGCRFMGYDSV